MNRTHLSLASRSSRAAFAAAAAVALYTAAGYGGLLYLGLSAAEACVLAAAAGIAVAAVAGRVVLRSELRARERRFASAQLDSARDRATARPRALAPPRSAKSAIEQREIRASREIQLALLPRDVPFLEGYHVEVDYQPCGVLGGDLYDFHQYEDGRLLLTLGDVSGKGPSGAIVMAMVQTLFRDHRNRATGPADLLRRVNDGFAGTLGKGIFVTALAGILDPDGNRLTLAGAGHHPIFLLNAAERRTTQVATRGLALGIASGPPFLEAMVETTIDLSPGDSLLLYTDGATDSVDDIADGVGESRLLAAASGAVLEGPHGALQRLREDLWQGGGRRDDTTLMLVSRVGSNPVPRFAADPASARAEA